MKHTICRKVRSFKKQNTILVSHLEIILKFTNLINILLILSFIFTLASARRGLFLLIINFLKKIRAGIPPESKDVLTGASITTICFTANGIVFICLMMVKIFVSSYNPQITKARANNLKLHKSNITLNSGLSMRVGISEAIRMLFFFSLKLLFILFEFENKNIKKKQNNLNLFQVLLTSLFNFPVKFRSALYSTAEFYKGEYKSNTNIDNLKHLIPQSDPLAYGASPNGKGNIKYKNIKTDDKRFNQWLAGLIDGDGCFLLSKKGYASLEIIAHIRDKNCLYQIKQKFGGAIKLRTNLNHLRFRMHHKQGMLDIIKAVNGEIRNPIRLLQLSKICDKYNIPVLKTAPLTFENAWLSGFFDSDGSIYLNLKSYQMLITASQKNKFLLDMLCELYGGSVYIEKISFKWVVFRKSEISKLIEYFKLNPCRSAKLNRINAIPKYYELRDLKAHLVEESTILGKAWKKFLLRWDKWEKIK